VLWDCCICLVRQLPLPLLLLLLPLLLLPLLLSRFDLRHCLEVCRNSVPLAQLLFVLPDAVSRALLSPAAGPPAAGAPPARPGAAAAAAALPAWTGAGAGHCHHLSPHPGPLLLPYQCC